MPIYPVVVEIFQSGPKWWTYQQTDRPWSHAASTAQKKTGTLGMKFQLLTSEALLTHRWDNLLHLNSEMNLVMCMHYSIRTSAPAAERQSWPYGLSYLPCALHSRQHRPLAKPNAYESAQAIMQLPLTSLHFHSRWVYIPSWMFEQSKILPSALLLICLSQG